MEILKGIAAFLLISCMFSPFVFTIVEGALNRKRIRYLKRKIAADEAAGRVDDIIIIIGRRTNVKGMAHSESAK